MLNLPPISERRGVDRNRTLILPTHQSLDNNNNPLSAYNSTNNSPLIKSSSLSPQQMPTKRSQFATQGNNVLAQVGIRSTTRHATNVSLPDRVPQTTSQVYNDGSQMINNSQNRSQYYSQPPPQQQAYYNNSMSMQMGYGQQPVYQASTPLLSVGYEYPPSFQYYGGGGGGGGPRLLPQPSFAKVANNEHDKKLLSLIERQTEVIGHLNTKIMQQENQKIQRDKKELRSRLKQLEMANALKQRELEYRVQNTLLTNSPKLPKMQQLQSPDDGEKKKGSDRILSVLGKFVLATEMADSQKKNKPGNKRKYGSFLQAAFQGLKGSQSEKGVLGGADRITYTENDQLYYSTKGTDNGDSPFSKVSNNNDDDD